MFDDVQIPEKIADQVVRGPDPGRVHSPSSEKNSREEEILEVIQLFPPERFSERIVVQIVEVPVPRAVHRTLKLGIL